MEWETIWEVDSEEDSTGNIFCVDFIEIFFFYSNFVNSKSVLAKQTNPEIIFIFLLYSGMGGPGNNMSGNMGGGGNMGPNNGGGNFGGNNSGGGGGDDKNTTQVTIPKDVSS